MSGTSSTGCGRPSLAASHQSVFVGGVLFFLLFFSLSVSLPLVLHS